MAIVTKFIGRVAVLSAVLASPWLVSAAEVKPGTEYRDRVKVDETVQPLGDSPFGESVNLVKGGISFLQPDINYPGTGPTIRLSRTYSLGGNATGTMSANEAADWSLTIPRIQTILPGDRFNKHGEWKTNSSTNPYARCSGFSQISVAPFSPLGQAWWHGYQLLTEDGSQQTLLSRTSENTVAPSAGTYNIVTTKNWMVSCLSATANGMPGDAFLVTSPDGTRYWFNQLVYGPAVETLELTMGGSSATTSGTNTAAQTTTASLTQQSADAPVADLYGGGTTAYLPRKMGYMFVTRIEDRFGNYLTYSYTNNKLTEISGSDGRKVSIDWNSPVFVIKKITIEPLAVAAPQVWTYNYNADYSALTSVVLPDSASWTFALNFLDREDVPADFSDPYCSVTSVSNVGVSIWKSGSMTHPSGLTGTFDTGMVGFARSKMPSTCQANTQTWDQPITYLGLSLLKKTFTGPGITPQVWTYNYSDAVGSTAAQCTASGCATTSYVEVMAPDNSVSRYVHSNAFDSSEGRLVSVYMGLSAFNLTNPVALQKITKGYAANSAGPWPTRFGSSLENRGLINTAIQEQVGPENSSVTEQQGVAFSRITNAFDIYTNPLSVTKASVGGAAGNFSKLEVSTYQHDLASWVLSLPRTVSCVGNTDCGASPGLVMSEIDYGANDLPWHIKTFGVLNQTLTYASNGQPASVADGRGNTTTFATWYRGMPTSVTFPATPGGVPSTTMSANITPNGQISDVTDQSGGQTCYDHDAMGRISKVFYPVNTANTVATCDRPMALWQPRSQAFSRPAVVEYGLAVGHWKQTVSTGNGQVTTYYDAKWQPVLTVTEDTANALTKSFIVNRYDVLGRKSFTSYPVASLTSVGDALTGVRTSYDALGRVTQVQQDDGATPGAAVLNTVSDYPTGFQTRVTNPRQFATTTSYQAYDGPTTDAPVLISLPEAVTTRVDRQPSLAKPVTVSRSGTYGGIGVGLSRTYAYDANERLCKTINPESGASIVDYDAAGNIAWSAEGQPYTTSATSCDRTLVADADKTFRSYDALNRVTQVTTPGGVANVTTTYEPDGLVKSLSAAQPGGASVLTEYFYNRRRLLTSENSSQPGWYLTTIGYNYDTNGHETSLLYPDMQQVNYAPDALGRPTQVGSYATGIGYYPNGAISGFTYGNGLVRTMTQNFRRLPAISLDKKPDNSVIAISDTISYDANGNVLGISDGVPGGVTSRTMSYDGLDRLVSASSPGQWGSATYAYDPVDNLRLADIGGTAARQYRYSYSSISNRLTDIKTPLGTTVFGFGYDARGNQTLKGGQGYQFDSANRLTEVTGKENYRYDGLGRRVFTWSPPGTIMLWQYAQDGRELYASDGRRSQNRTNIYLGNTVLATRTVDWGTGAVNVRYLHTDALGSPVAETGPTGVILKRNSYEPYGAAYGSTSIDGIGYTGHVMDQATGLTYMQQRYYDPVIGGFLSVDPMAVNPATAANFCRYCYANDNPYRFTDPDGRQSANFVMPNGVPLDPNNLPKDPPPKVAAPPDLPKGLSASTLATGDTKPTGKISVAAGVGVKVEKTSGSPAKVSVVTPALGGEASVTWNLATITYDASDKPTDSPVDVSLGLDIGVVFVGGISVGWAPPAKFELKVDGGFGVAGKARYDGASYDVGLTPGNIP